MSMLVVGGTYPGDGLALREVARKYPGRRVRREQSG